MSAPQDKDLQSPTTRVVIVGATGLVGSTLMRILDPAPDPEAVKQISSRFRELFPQIGEVTLKARWAGMIDAMPDMVPVVDHVAAIPGLVVATGMSGHGFGIGPGMGRVIADLIHGDDVGHDLRRFRFSRFSDGSPLRLGPAL